MHARATLKDSIYCDLVSCWSVCPVREVKRLLLTRTFPDSPAMMAHALFGFCINLKQQVINNLVNFLSQAAN